jgi:hypothetical protein
LFEKTTAMGGKLVDDWAMATIRTGKDSEVLDRPATDGEQDKGNANHVL